MTRRSVMIIAGESSGELYGALLAEALTSRWHDVRIIGIGGERMKQAGVKLLADITSSFGITEVVSSLRKLRNSLNKVRRAIVELSPAVVVLIDYPDFNFRVARMAKERGVKVLYYVSPQVWAWRKGRIKTMKEITDRIAVLFPFEETIYRAVGAPCEFVGHPVMEEIEGMMSGSEKESLRDEIRASYGLAGGNPLIALLPGSRTHELKTLLPVYDELVKAMKRDYPGGRFVVPLAPNIHEERFEDDISRLKGEGTHFVSGSTIQALYASDMAVIASGTATLQAALLGIPMVVVYKVSPLTYLIGRMLIDVPHISLVNIILGDTVVPELIQHRATAANIQEELKLLIEDREYRSRMVSSFTTIRGMFTGKRPSRRVAEMVGELAGWQQGIRTDALGVTA